MRLVYVACVAALGTVLVCAPRGAAAQGILPGSGGSSGTSQLGQDSSRPSDSRRIKVADAKSRLFDLSSSTSSIQLDAGPIWYRPQAAGKRGFQHGVGELALGTVTTARWQPFYLAGHHKVTFRAFDSKSYHGSFGSDFATGAYWGPLQVESRIGLNLLNVSAFHGEWSADLLSPRVSVAAAVHVWRFRVDIQAHSEYLWRWFGNDYLVHGVTLGLRLDLPSSDPLLTKGSSAH